MSDTGVTYTGEMVITEETWEEMDKEILAALAEIEKDFKVKIEELTVVRTVDGLKVQTEALSEPDVPEVVDASDN
jgi:hypothetical protein